jgi:glycosyltransferase involved in cell wall biosynthesis
MAASKTTNNILFLHGSSDLYGASKVLFQTIIACVQKGDHCIVVLSETGPFSEKLEALGVKIYFFKLGILRRKYNTPLGILNRLYYLWKAHFSLKNIIKQHNIHLIYSNTTAVIVGALTSKLLKKPHIWHIHEIIATPRPLLWFLSYLMEHCSNLNITVSAATFHHWNSLNPSLAKQHKLITLFNGLDPTSYLGIAHKTNMPLVVGMIGRVHFWKGQTYFIEIAHALAQLNPKVHFVMAGDPFPGYEYLLADIEKMKLLLGMQTAITDLGYITNNKLFFDQIDLLITPSVLPDPLPTVILEAMAASKPVAATKMGGALDMIIPNETGILIPWDNAKEAAAQINELLMHPTTMQMMGEKGRARVVSHFSIERYNKEIYQAIASLLAMNE